MVTQPEAARLIRTIAATGFPIPDEDPEYLSQAWAIVLHRFTLQECLDAIAELATEVEYTIRPPDIAKKIRLWHRHRLEAYGQLPAPNAPDPSSDDLAATRAWKAETVALQRLVASGGIIPGTENDERPVRVDVHEYLNTYQQRREGVSLTGSHRLLAITAPGTRAEIEAGKAALANLGAVFTTPDDEETP